MHKDLRSFIQDLEKKSMLHRIKPQVEKDLQITEISSRALKKGSGALLFENVSGFDIPVLSNLFASLDRINLALGIEDAQGLRELGELLAFLRSPDAPTGAKDIWQKLKMLKRVFYMPNKIKGNGACREVVYKKQEVDLNKLPITKCWALDAAPLITWGLVVTKNADSGRINLGVYRLQLLSKNQLIFRALAHRGGALDLRLWQKRKGDEPFPVSVIIGADPATILSAVTPVPDSLSEYAYAGLLRGARSELTKGLIHDLPVPTNSEIVLEGFIYPNQFAEEGPFGDHTGYYNEVEKFPILQIEAMSHRKDPIYLTTYTGRAPDEPAIMALALNEMLIPMLQKQYSEIVDFYLPLHACSYRMAVVSINKQFDGHARQIMFGVWGFLRQFMYTKMIVVVDSDINIRDMDEVLWAISTKCDPARDTMIIDRTPIDYLDFASPEPSLGSKIGIDATDKTGSETHREWGVEIKPDPTTKAEVDKIWDSLGI